MARRLMQAAAFCCALAIVTAGILQAQSVRPEQTFYLQPRIGFTSYVGDFDVGPFNFEEFDVSGAFPIGFGLELGYQINPSFGVSAAYTIGDYPLIRPLVDGEQTEDSWRHTVNLFLKYTFGARSATVAPFVQAGLNGVFGLTMPEFDQAGNPNEDAGDSKVGFGPSAGVGLDIVLSNRISLITELITNFVFPDEAADGADTGRGGSFDMLNFFGVGLKYNFKSAFTPVNILSVSCPTALSVDETGTFTAMVDMRASRPVEHRWDFGDGTAASGLTATHSFSRAGTYSVSFTGSNVGSTDSESCVVEVRPLPVAAEIISVTGSPATFELCEPVTVRFSANVLGDEPLTYSWDFGDGTTGSGSAPTHTYTRPGDYTVTLSLSNAQGSSSRSITIQARECEADACADVTDLNSVYFAQNSSTLSDEARRGLGENLEILRECPDICVRAEGWAAPGERNPQQLSEDRARAVAQYYTNNGIAASRITSAGLGRTAEMTTKKEDAAQFRRADSIPVPCQDFGR